MAIRVAINGFGRIGRLTFRNLYERSDEFEVVVGQIIDCKHLELGAAFQQIAKSESSNPPNTVDCYPNGHFAFS